jgi:hypothetical protein
MIGLSRYVRMYSMLVVCLFVVAVAVYQCCEGKSSRVRWLWAVVGSVSLILAVTIFKELALAMCGAIMVYVAIRWLAYLFRRQPADRYWFWLGSAGVVPIVLAVALQTLGYNIYPADAIIVRAAPHWTYLQHLYDNWQLAGVAGVLAIIGLLSQLIGAHRQWRSFTVYSAVLSSVVIVYFVLLSHRWDAQRYLSFVMPFVTIVTTVGLYTSASFIYRIVAKPRWLAVTLTGMFVLVVGPWLSLTGLPGTDFIARQAVADRSAAELGYADVKSAYQYVLDHYQTGEIVLMQTPRFYYWSDSTVPVRKLGGYQRLTFADFKTLAAEGKTGGWVIYNFTHQRHLRSQIKTYIDNRFEEILTLRAGLVHVYHFTPTDLAERRKKKK